MKIVVLGTRGIPDIQGGIETHCEALYPKLAQQGLEIILLTRKPYLVNQTSEYQGVALKALYTPKIKSLETIIHSLLGIIVAFKMKPDILHIHAIGPSLVIPLARLLGLKVVMTHHGADYEREKWGRFAKFMLKLGEKFAASYAQQIIVISKTIQNALKDKYSRDSCLIYNGVNPAIKSNNTDYLDSLALKPQQYVIAIGRFVEEKGFHDLITAFSTLQQNNYQLVLVGNADHKTEYSEKLIQLAKDNRVILTGFIKGEKLTQIYTHAKLFVLPSYHEGLPISLLEAMSYDLNVLVSDIPAHIEVKLAESCYFAVGNIEHLTEKLHQLLATDEKFDYSKLLAKYDWNKIALQTVSVYQKVNDSDLPINNKQ